MGNTLFDGKEASGSNYTALPHHLGSGTTSKIDQKNASIVGKRLSSNPELMLILVNHFFALTPSQEVQFGQVYNS